MAFVDLLKNKIIKENQNSSYGYCPECNAKGEVRERRIGGNDKCTNGHTYPSKSSLVAPKNIVGEAKEFKAEDLLRTAGFKIRLVTPTSFGTQIDFAKLYNTDEIKKILTDFQIKIKDKSVFIVK